MFNYALAIICIIAAVVYFAIPAGQLPTHMPGYESGSEYIQTEHAIIAIIYCRDPRWGRVAGTPPVLLAGGPRKRQ
jgi:hypothetical protein